MAAKKKRRPEGREKVKDPRRRAGILVLAELVGDEKAAGDSGVSARSIRRWRHDLDNDPDLAVAYADRLSSRSLQKLEVLVEKAATRAIALLDQVEAENIRDVIAVIDTAAGLLVERDALTKRQGDADGKKSAAHREGAPPAEDPPLARAEPVH